MEKQTINKKEIVKKLLKQEISIEDESDLIEMLIDKPITIDVDKQEDKTLTRGEKLADKLSAVAGSWGFIIGFGLFLIAWIILNVVLSSKAADPYPFILLNLLLSCLASLQAPIIMMSQNRQAKKDSLRNQNDYKVLKRIGTCLVALSMLTPGSVKGESYNNVIANDYETNIVNYYKQVEELRQNEDFDFDAMLIYNFYDYKTEDGQEVPLLKRKE